MSFEVYNPRQSGNKRKRIRGGWVPAKAPSYRNCQAAKGPFEIWDLGSGFSEDTYREIQDSRFGLMIPVFNSFSNFHDKEGLQTASKKDPKVKKRKASSSMGKSSKGTTSMVGCPVIPLPLPVSPSSLLSSLSSSFVLIGPLGFTHFLHALSHLVGLAKDKQYKKKRAKLNPSLRNDPKSFEVTKEESRKFFNRVNFGDCQPRKSTTFLNFLVEIGVITKIKSARRTSPSRGATYAFTCDRFKEYPISVSPDYIEKSKAKVTAMIKERDNHPLVQIYRANVKQYSLSEEDIERLPYYIGLDDEGEPKFYEPQYLSIKNWDGITKAKRGSYHSIYSQIPDVFRVRRRDENGVYLALVDISSAHAVFLYWLLKVEILRDKEKGLNVEKDLYEIEQFGKDVSLRRLYDKFAKKPFLSLLNAWDGIEAVEEVANDFQRQYPLTAQRLSNTKSRNKNKLYHLLHPMVNALMEEAVWVCKEWGFDAMILGDELDVPEHEALRVKDLLLDLIFEHTGLETWVKVTTREGDQRFRYQTKAPCPEGLCPNCWSENKAIRIESPFPCGHIKAKTDCQTQPEASMGAQTQDEPIF